MDKPNMINFDQAKVKRLKKRYDKAVLDKEESFIFEDNEYLTTYAKYMLEYLDTLFKARN